MNLKFWKKKEDNIEGMGRNLGLESSNLGLERPVDESYDKLGQDLRPQEMIDSSRYSSPQIQQFSQNNDVQLISAKLDTLKAMLDVINQRLNAIEKATEDRSKQKLW